MRAHSHIAKSLLTFSLLLSALLVSASADAQDYDEGALVRHFADSIMIENTDISLVTCEPFNKVYSLYGHTGLCIKDHLDELELLANWGIFDMNHSNFIPRFILGLTDYRMDVEDWGEFCWRYAQYGCGIYVQTLDLTWEEKRALIDRVLENYKPENRYYRYNYFYDNCTTRVRDIIEASVSGVISYPERSEERSWRELIHSWNDTHLWARWGNDFLLGIPADRKTSAKEAQFLPFNLAKDFDSATIIRDNGETRPLVCHTSWAVRPMYCKGSNTVMSQYVLSPTGVATAYLVLLVVIYAIEVRMKRRLWLFDGLVLLSMGFIGLVLFVMIFSRHPAVSLNAQILVYNPLALLFLPAILKSLRCGRQSPFLTAMAAMAGLGIVAGIIFQRFSEGTMALALFLIMTYMRRTGIINNEKRQE